MAQLETALGAEILRADLLGGRRPRLADRYTVERFLGRGATALVVAAKDERLAVDVALKLSVADAGESGLAEARVLARLEHPNVVRVFDVLTTEAVIDGKTFRLSAVAMQRVPGRSLRAWLAEKPRSATEILEVFATAGAGLAAAHALRIVHRDFKPDNVVVREDGVAQVIDFGFAIPQRAEPDGGDVAGTSEYLAPEARLGVATAASDQYAFAVSLAEALTGEARAPSTRPAEAPTGVDPSIWVALRMGTHPDPARRFESLERMLELLRLTRWNLRFVPWIPLILLGFAAIWWLTR